MTDKIVIVDDHAIVRHQVRIILQARPQWEIVGEASNGKEAVEQAKKLNADVIIMDITMPEMSGIEATREITKLKMRSAVLIFTMHESKNLVHTLREAGARGIVQKSHAVKDLLEALEALLAGRDFFGRDGANPPDAKESAKPSAMFSIRVRPD
jgi:DNA-binding NarL/FixJ family response regulator